LKLAKVRELVGDWPAAGSTAEAALAIALELGDRRAEGWCHAALAEVSRKQGQLDAASDHLIAAEAAFRAVDAEDGIGRVLHLGGTLAAQTGDYETARSRYQESLRIRERLDDKASMGGLLSNLGVVAEYQGDYAESRQFNERALALRTELGDRWSIAVSQNNLGMLALHEEQFQEARDRFTETMRLNLEVGDPWMVAIAQNNLGNANRGLGDIDDARRSYAAALAAYRALDDRWAMAFLLEDIAVLLGRTAEGATDAFRLLGAAETLRSEIGSPRGPGLDAELASSLSAARTSVGDGSADAAIGDGRTMGFDAAMDLAAGRCQAA
jgi:tetratricopeptide (TPR) repeat protein